MKTVTATELRRNASRLLGDVEAGESILVTRRGKPIAAIRPVHEEPSRLPSWKRPGLRLVTPGAGLAAAILQERGA